MTSKKLSLILYLLSSIMLIASNSIQIFQSDRYKSQAFALMGMILVICVSFAIKWAFNSFGKEKIGNVIFTISCTIVFCIVLISNHSNRETESLILYSIISGGLLAEAATVFRIQSPKS